MSLLVKVRANLRTGSQTHAPDKTPGSPLRSDARWGYRRERSGAGGAKVIRQHPLESVGGIRDGPHGDLC